MRLKELQESKTQLNNILVKMIVVSNISFEPYFELLINKTFSKDNHCVEVIPIDFVEFLSSGYMEQYSDCDMIVVIPNFNGFYPDLFYNIANLGSKEIRELMDKEKNYIIINIFVL